MRDTDGADFRFKRQRGEEAILERESVCSGRIEEPCHGLWVLLKKKPDEVSLELAFVGDASLDGLAVVRAAGGGFGKWSAAQGHAECKGARVTGDEPARRADDFRAHFRVRIVGERFERGDDFGGQELTRAEDAHGLAADVSIRVFEQRFQNGQVRWPNPFQGPQRADAFGGGLRRVGEPGLELRFQRLELPVGDGLPGQMTLRQGFTAEPGEQFTAGEFVEVGHRERFLEFVLHAPDAAAFLVTLGMVSRDFVV